MDEPDDKIESAQSLEDNPSAKPLVDNPLFTEGEEIVWTRYARVVDGVVVEAPVDFPRDPNDWFSPELPGVFFLCPDTQVDCHWLYDAGTQTYSPPPPVTLPPYSDTTSTTDLLAELKSNPELLEELRKLLVK